MKCPMHAAWSKAGSAEKGQCSGSSSSWPFAPSDGICQSHLRRGGVFPPHSHTSSLQQDTQSQDLSSSHMSSSLCMAGLPSVRSTIRQVEVPEPVSNSSDIYSSALPCFPWLLPLWLWLLLLLLLLLEPHGL